jgi:predicted kinase
MLIVFSGLPGTGKTTLARQLAARLSATYLRIDEIEQGIRDTKALTGDIGPAGYIVAQALAESNLVIGNIVIVDCVNPVAESRSSWRAVSDRTGAVLVDLEIICSDLAEHRRRVEGRTSDIPGLTAPTWQSVQKHEYEPWLTNRLVIDSAVLSPEDGLATIASHLDQNRMSNSFNRHAV